tara:strand:+ start:26 stop:1222 length:1197 start_codon:yes stop_codon:yes gene_type:complete
MAQVSDYNIANASGASVRSDLNAVFSAIKTLNSGSSDPSNTEAFMPYVDTADNNNLKIRNSSNNGFTTIGPVDTPNLGLLTLSGGTMTGQLLGDDGSVAGSPAYAFDNDTDTGMFRFGANDLGFSTGGTQRVGLTSDGLHLLNDLPIMFQTTGNRDPHVALKPPSSLSSTVTFTLPATDGSNGDVIKTDGSGNLSFTTLSTAGTALTGNTLASNITASSLTSVGTLTSLTVSGSITGSIASSNISGSLFTLGSTSITRGSTHSTITVTNSRASNFQDSAGNNGSTPVQIQQGRAKAWVNFDGTGTVSIRDDFNVSSIVDNGTGDYAINFSTAMANSNYAAVVTHNHDSPGGSNTRQIGFMDSPYNANGFRVTIELPNSSPGNSRANSNRVTAAVFGDQ